MKKYLIIISVLFYFAGCNSGENIISNNRPLKHNFIFTAESTFIDNPDKDRRAFYKIFIDKVETGRTDTALESQKKFFKDNLQSNKHLLKVEKWVLNLKKGSYVKLNNIEQPKPNYIYFSCTSDKLTKIELKMGKYGKASFLKK